MTRVGIDNLRLEIEADPTGLVNEIANPDGDLGSWGWLTPVANTVMTTTTVAEGNALQFKTTVSQAGVYARSELMPATVGLYYAARVDVEALTASHTVRASLYWFDSAQAPLSQTAVVGQSATGTLYTAAFQAPVGAAYVALRLDWSKSTGNPDANSSFTFRHAMVTYTTTGAPVAVRTNLVTNPSMETNTTGWAIGTNGYTISRAAKTDTVGGIAIGSVVGNYVLQGYVNSGTPNAAGYLYTASMPVTAGLPYAFSAYLKTSLAGMNGGIMVRFYDASGKAIGADRTTTTSMSATAWKRVSAVYTAPAGAVTTRLFVFNQFTGNSSGFVVFFVDAALVEQSATVGAYFDGASADTAQWLYDWTGTPHNSTSNAQSAPDAFEYEYSDPTNYIDILGSVHSIHTERDELNVGVLTATVINPYLDPAVAAFIKPGRRMRWMVKQADDTWQAVFTGRLYQAQVAYDLVTSQESRRATITLTAHDNGQQLSQPTRTDGVGTIAELPYVLEGAGVPWNVNGSGSQIASANVVAYVEGGKAIDQVALTRDSTLGYAWVDRVGVLQAWGRDKLSATIKATLDETVYNPNISIDYDTDRVIDAVQVTLLTYDVGHGIAGSTTYPSDSTAYIAPGTRGEHLQTFTVAGLTQAQIESIVDEVFAANATPARRVNSVVISITLENLELALLDLYDLVRVINARAAIDENHRIVGITHDANARQDGGTEWLMTISFVIDGSVAMPQLLPTPQTGKVGAAGTSQVVRSMLAGSLVITPTGSSAPYKATATVTFDIPFEVPPFVTVSAWTSVPEDVAVALAGGPTNESFVIALARTDSRTATSVHWQAAGT